MKERKEEIKLSTSYERKFVFLSPQDKGYESVLGNPPKGHLEIERKKATLILKVFVENLKEMDYEVQLFDHEENYVSLGDFSVGSNGKAGKKFNTSSVNVKGSQSGLKDFEVIVIRALGEEHKRKAPLVAWLKGKKGKVPVAISQEKGATSTETKKEPIELEKQIQEEWKEKPTENKETQEITEQKAIVKSKEPEQKEQLLVKEKEEEEKNHQEKPLEETIEQEFTNEDSIEGGPSVVESEAEFSNQEKDFSEKIQEKIEESPFKQERIELESREQQIEERPIESGKMHLDPEEGLSDQEEYVIDYEEPLKKEGEGNEENAINLESPYFYINENLKSLQDTLTPYTPFTPGLKDHKWWQITGQEENLERFYLFFNGSFVPITYPYMKYQNIGNVYVKKYNYRIFGMVFDEKYSRKSPLYYVYGIPGRMCIQDQPFQGNTGYLYWHPAQSHERQRGVMGYWLLYVDAHSGTIAVPKRPTIPPIYRG